MSPEDQQAQDEAQAARDYDNIARLDALAQSLFTYRKEAIEARALSGIEDEWREAQDAYEGYDDANRPERDMKRAAWQSRPVGQMPINKIGTRSTVFLNITRPYVDASAGRVADMLFPTDDRPWGLKSEPIPELSDARDSQAPVTLPNGQQSTEGQLVQSILDIADKKAKRAETRIDDWLTECQWHAENRKVILSAARIGTGVLKGPSPYKKRKVRIDASSGQAQMTVEEKINPRSNDVNVWNLFPDPACGDNIHNGSWIWERDDITQKGLVALKGLPGYLESQIDLVIQEGPQLPTAETRDFAPRNVLGTRQPFDIWYFTGTIDRDEMEAAGCDCTNMAGESIEAVVTMVNNRVIRASLNPLDSGDFPYDVLCWQAREGYWAGFGVGQQISVAQRGINAATRNMMDNAGISAGPQIITVRNVVQPVDGKWELVPRKFWTANEDADIRDVEKAFIVINIPTMQVELMNIIQFYLKMAEDVTGLPMLLQGQQGKAPDTVGGMTMLQNNASGVLRRLARLFDDNITEPHVGRYYDWLMQYGEDPEEKGAFSIDARASSVLVERDIQNQAVLQLLGASTNPAYGMDPRKVAKEAIAAQKLDPKRFQYSDDEWKNIQANMAQQPSDPRIVVAQMKGEMEKANQQWEERLKQIELSFEAGQNERERALKHGIAELQAEVDMAIANGDQTISVQSIRGKLADTTIKVRAQERISDKSNVVKQITKPPTEPKGRAPAGQAYQA